MPRSERELREAMPAISRALTRWRRNEDAEALERAFELLLELFEGDRRVALVALVEFTGQ